MSDKVLLREFFEMSSDDSLLTEADRKKINEGELIMAGVMQRADAENGNGRVDRKSTRLNSSHSQQSRMPSSA